MLLFPLGKDVLIGPGGSASSPRSNVSSHVSAMLKTTQYNDFLSLLSQGRPLNGASTTKTSLDSTTINASSMLQARPQTSENHTYFGLKPKRQGVEDTKNDGGGIAKQIVPTGIEENQELDEDLVVKPASDDPDIDMLIEGMKDHVVIKDLAIKDSRAINLSHGYSMESEIGPTDFYKTKSDIKKHVKRKRLEGVVPKSLRRDWKNTGGFKPQEVNFSGAVSLEGCRPSTLKNEIHPLLIRSRFDGTPDAIYDQLMPALRLASMFLTQPVCMQFWVTVAMGKREDDHQMSRKYGKKCQRLANHVEMTKNNTARVIKHLRELGEADIIHFAFKHKLLHGVGGGAWATSGPICDYLGVRKTYGLNGTLTRSIIRLHADHYIIAKKLSQLKYPEISQQLRFSFFFATLIMHELAHSIEGAYMKMRHDQWAEYQRSKTYIEPFWMDWQRPPECGKAWEQTMFGGEIQPVNNRVDGSHGVGMSDWPPKGSDVDPERRIWYTIPMTYIEKLFQTTTWEGRRYGLQDWDAFHIPRTGATSLYINYFTTMPYSEDQRVAHEELKELIATVTEQPPPKMRMVSGGGREAKMLGKEEVIRNAVAEQEQVETGRVTPVVRGTRRLSTVMVGELPTDRDGADADVVKGPSCRRLYELAETVRKRTAKGSS